MQDLSSTGMKVDSEGEDYAQGEGLRFLSGVCVEHWRSAVAQIGNRHHLRNERRNQGHTEKLHRQGQLPFPGSWLIL